MKATEQKRSNHQPARSGQTFFNKGQEGSFFSTDAEQAFFDTTTVQPKLTIGQPNDPYEVEADQMAEQVVQRLEMSGDGAMGPVAPDWFVKAPVVHRQENDGSLVQKDESGLGPVEEAPVARKETPDSSPVILQEEEDAVEVDAEGAEPDVQTHPLEADLPDIDAATQNGSELTPPAEPFGATHTSPIILQPKCEACEQEEVQEEAVPELQRAMDPIGPPADPSDEDEDASVMMKSEGGGRVASSGLEQTLKSSAGTGSPLRNDTKTDMESAFGADFSGVRIHTDAPAAEMNRGLNAQAFTHGSDIYFNQGKFNPETRGGQQLLAHELTHVVQQGHASSIQQKSETSTPTIQKEEDSLAGQAWNALASGASWVGEQVSSGVETVSDAASSVVNLGRSALASVVEPFSPTLAAFIRRGAFAVLKEKVEGLAERWLGSLRDRFDIQGAVEGMRNWLGGSIDSVSAAVEGDDASCSAFSRMVDTVKNFVFEVLDHPFLQQMRAGISRANDVFADVAAMFVQAQIQQLEFIWGGVQSLGRILSNGFQRVREGVSWAWDQIAELLGITSEDQEGVLEWVKSIAQRAWENIKTQIVPAAIEAFMQTGRLLYRISGLKAAFEFIDSAERFGRILSWLWENRDNPNIVADANRNPDIKNTIIPTLLEEAGQFKADVQQQLTVFGHWAEALANSLLSLLGQVMGVPLLRTARWMVEKLKSGIEVVRNWASENVAKIKKKISKFVEKLSRYLRPVLSVMAWIAIGFSVPGSLPVVVAALLGAGIWTVLPDCYKGPVIDLVLDIAIRALELSPDVPMFGPLWSLFKPGVLGFLREIKGRETEEKIAVVQRVVEMFVFAGLDFILGFVWGLLKGLVGGIIDPFILLYYIGKGLFSLVRWVSNLSNRFFGDGRQLQSMTSESGAPPAQQQAAPAVPEGCEPESVPALDASVPEGSGGLENVPDSEIPVNHAAGERLRGMGRELAGPAQIIQENISQAFEEYFQHRQGMDYEGLRARFGSWWGEAQSAIEEKGGSIARCMVGTMLSPNARQIGASMAFTVGEIIGWISGTIIIEVVLFLISAGIVTVSKAILKPLVWIAKFIDKIGDLFMVVFKVLKPLAAMFARLMPRLTRLIGGAARGAMAKVVNAFGSIGRIIARLADDIPGFALTRAGREFVETAAERAAREAAERAARGIGEEASERGGRGIGHELSEESAERSGRELTDETQDQVASGAQRTAETRNLSRSDLDLLNRTREKTGAELTPEERVAEFRIAQESPRRPLPDDPKYIQARELPNGHTWRQRRRDGGWCRFTTQHCFDTDEIPTEFNTDIIGNALRQVDDPAARRGMERLTEFDHDLEVFQALTRQLQDRPEQLQLLGRALNDHPRLAQALGERGLRDEVLDQVIRNDGVRKVFIEHPNNPHLLNDLWYDFTRIRRAGQELRTSSFEDYIGTRGFSTSDEAARRIDFEAVAEEFGDRTVAALRGVESGQLARNLPPRPGTNYNAHHIIPTELLQHRGRAGELLRQALEEGFEFNSRAQGIWLERYSSVDRFQRGVLIASPSGVHASHPRYTEQIIRLFNEHSPSSGRTALQHVEEVMTRVQRAIQDNLDSPTPIRLNELDITG